MVIGLPDVVCVGRNEIREGRRRNLKCSKSEKSTYVGTSYLQCGGRQMLFSISSRKMNIYLLVIVLVCVQCLVYVYLPDCHTLWEPATVRAASLFSEFGSLRSI